MERDSSRRPRWPCYRAASPDWSHRCMPRTWWSRDGTPTRSEVIASPSSTSATRPQRRSSAVSSSPGGRTSWPSRARRHSSPATSGCSFRILRGRRTRAGSGASTSAIRRHRSWSGRSTWGGARSRRGSRSRGTSSTWRPAISRSSTSASRLRHRASARFPRRGCTGWPCPEATRTSPRITLPCRSSTSATRRRRPRSLSSTRARASRQATSPSPGRWRF